MSLVTQANPIGEKAGRLPSRFRRVSPNIEANQYDRVFSFFDKVFSDSDSAGKFTDEIFRIAQVNQLSIDSIMEEFENSSETQIPALLAYYLNTVRNTATYLGVSSRLVPPVGVARNIRV